MLGISDVDSEETHVDNVILADEFRLGTLKGIPHMEVDVPRQPLGLGALDNVNIETIKLDVAGRGVLFCEAEFLRKVDEPDSVDSQFRWYTAEIATFARTLFRYRYRQF